MTKQAVHAHGAPAGVGPYSQAIRAGGFVFTSGQIPVRPDGTLIMEDIQQAARQCLENIRAVLEAGGAEMGNVVKVTVFLTDMDQFAQVNDVYAGFFDDPPPARSCIEVRRLPKGAPIEMEAVACLCDGEHKVHRSGCCGTADRG